MQRIAEYIIMAVIKIYFILEGNWNILSRVNLPFQFEADRRAIIITINSFGTELTKDDRAKLYPRCGKLHPDGLAALARADDYEQVKAVAEYYAVRGFVTD